MIEDDSRLKLVIIEDEGGFGFTRGERKIATPAGRTLLAPTPALAEAVREEWLAAPTRGGGMTQLLNTMLDRVEPDRPRVAASLVEMLATDTVCFRVAEPAELADEQTALLDPLLEWFEETAGYAPAVTRGAMPIRLQVPPPPSVPASLLALSPAGLTVLSRAAGLASSLVIGLAFAAARIDTGDAFAAATIEERYSLRRWGEDDEARASLDRLRAEFEQLARFRDLARGGLQA